MTTKLNYVMSMPTGKIIYTALRSKISATINTEQKIVPGISKKEKTIPSVFKNMKQLFISLFLTIG